MMDYLRNLPDNKFGDTMIAAIGRMACDRNEVVRKIRRLSTRLEGSGIDICSIVKLVYGYEEKKTYSRRDIKRIFVKHFNPCSYGVINWLMPFSAATHATELNYLFDANVFVMPDPNKSTDPTSEELNFVWEAVSEDEEERHLCISKHTGMRTQFKEGRLKLLRGVL
uniref:Uncharacterized protein n=1 Tax=Parascaris equorum TaxID=6256 RepID=A0A914RJE9_PAREQ